MFHLMVESLICEIAKDKFGVAMSVPLFDHFTEIRVVESSTKPELVGQLGAILGISENDDESSSRTYAVKLDSYDRVMMFRQDQLRTTGLIRKRSDYY